MLVVDGCWLMGGSVFSTLECTTRSMDSSLECAVWILSIATVCILGVVYSYSYSRVCRVGVGVYYSRVRVVEYYVVLRTHT